MTNEKIQELLRTDIEPNEKSVHELMHDLKDHYQAKYGAVNLDDMDWHWQATALKNHWNMEKDNADGTTTGSESGSATDDPPWDTVEDADEEAGDEDASAPHE